MSKELTEAAWIAQEEPLSRENAALLYSLGVSNCGCCSLVTRESVKVHQDWFAEEIRKAKEHAYDEGHEDGWDTGVDVYRFGEMSKGKVNPYRKETQ